MEFGSYSSATMETNYLNRKVAPGKAFTAIQQMTPCQDLYYGQAVPFQNSTRVNCPVDSSNYYNNNKTLSPTYSHKLPTSALTVTTTNNCYATTNDKTYYNQENIILAAAAAAAGSTCAHTTTTYTNATSTKDSLKEENFDGVGGEDVEQQQHLRLSNTPSIQATTTVATNSTVDEAVVDTKSIPCQFYMRTGTCAFESRFTYFTFNTCTYILTLV